MSNNNNTGAVRTVDPLPALGRMPRRSDVRALLFSNFVKQQAQLPAKFDFWAKRKPFPLRTFGNTEVGDCTRAKQAVAAMRMERIEQRRTPQITDEEVLRVYYDMTARLYGGGDTGAYETDALSEWRKPDLTFRDTKGRPLTIDAFLRLNPANHDELRSAITLAGAHGVAICLNLPWAWSRIDPPADWALPAHTPLIGPWTPGSWGGHSLWSTAYDSVGIWTEHTWDIPRQRITWEAAAVYLDEAHLVIDKVNEWKKKAGAKLINFSAIKSEVNAVSSQKIK